MDKKSYLDNISNWNSYINKDYSEEECLVYQLNHDNHTEYQLSDLSFGLPEVTNKFTVDKNDPNTEITTNTKILVSAVTGSQYRGSDYYHYRRIDLNTQWQLLNDNDEVLLPEDIHDNDVKRFLFKKFPIRMDSIEIRDISKNGFRYLDISPIDNSLLYIGKVTLLRIDVNSPMSKLRRSNPITGFDYYLNTNEPERLRSTGFVDG